MSCSGNYKSCKKDWGYQKEWRALITRHYNSGGPVMKHCGNGVDINPINYTLIT